MAAGIGWRDRDVFSRRSRVAALFSALPAKSAARHFIHSTGKKSTGYYLYGLSPVFSGGVSVPSRYGYTGVDPC